jgi:metallo-beta-lactamase class B
MKQEILLVTALAGLSGLGLAATPWRPDPPITCDSCAQWNAPHKPFRLFGNTYYVGVAGLSSVLITSDKGHILLDGGLPQSAALIDDNIRALGFRTTDVRLIVNSHAHFDHAGGIAALQRRSGARVAASAAGARALAAGEPPADDPQYGLGRQAMAFPKVPQVQAVGDGEVLRVGALALTAHLTPGHTPGSTTWSWQSCEGPRCLSVVYADSLNPVAAPGYRFSGGPHSPGTADLFRQSIAKVAALPCDLVIAVHPGFTDVERKLKERTGNPGGPDPFIDARGCRRYAEDAAHGLAARLAEERAAP